MNRGNPIDGILKKHSISVSFISIPTMNWDVEDRIINIINNQYNKYVNHMLGYVEYSISLKARLVATLSICGLDSIALVGKV
jgi:hypothetical protein